VLDELRPEERAGTSVLGETMLDLIDSDPNVVLLDADLALGSKLDVVRDTRPEHFVSCGIHEQNMISVAAGLAEGGLNPFTHSFAAFASRRCFDQIFLSACFNGLGVKMIGTDPGVMGAHNGATHQCYEDMGALRGLPGITLLEASDSVQLENLLRQVARRDGVHYLRTFRRTPMAIYGSGSTFEIGTASEVRPGSDVTIIASGLLVSEAVEASAALGDQGISARVVDMFTWKPLDVETIARCAAETEAIVVAENHQVANGLGAAVAAAVTSTTPRPMGYVAVNDHFGEVGEMPFLRDKFGLNADNIVATAIETLERARG